jgi:hypothetical protein
MAETVVVAVAVMAAAVIAVVAVAATAAATVVAVAAMVAVAVVMATEAVEVAAVVVATATTVVTVAATKAVVTTAGTTKTKTRIRANSYLFLSTSLFLLMTSLASTVQEYLDELPQERKEPVCLLRDAIVKNLPNGFSEGMAYGMLGYAVPHSKYPAGYHADPKQPLPFVSIASQKNFIALYHMGLTAMPQLLQWFRDEYPKHSKRKLDMGKSCIRFKKPEQIPYNLIGELMQKVTPDEWIAVYEATVKDL